MNSLVCLLIGFIFGSIPSGSIIARIKGVDLRHSGSGNVGSTNVTRALGRGMGALTMVIDMLKAVVPILITGAIYRGDIDHRYLILLYTGLGAVLGHDFSPWLGLRGGKGVATSGGMVMMTGPLIFVVDFVTIFATAIMTGYVSLGSMLAACLYFVFNVYLVATHTFPGWGSYRLSFTESDSEEVIILAFVFTALVIWRHKDNIRRLLAGTENRIELIRK